MLGAAHGPVDVLVTCAGSATPGRFVDLDDAVFRDQMEVDYFGTLHAVRAVVPAMVRASARPRGARRRRPSRFVGIYGYSAYAPAKYAVRGLAETLRPELRPHGITVACAYPPDTDTPGFARENEQKPDGDPSDLGRHRSPGPPASVAAAIVKGIERDRLVITADPTTAALARAGGAARAGPAPVARPARPRRRLIRRSGRGGSGPETVELPFLAVARDDTERHACPTHPEFPPAPRPTAWVRSRSPTDQYWGAQTQRSLHHFSIGERPHARRR